MILKNNITMEKLKGKIPSSELIVLESSKEQWEIFSKGLINKLETTGLIKINERKIRININILKVYPPHMNDLTTTTSLNYTNSNKEYSEGMRRSLEFFSNLLHKYTWIIIGHIKGENNVPILITHYGNINMSVYAIQLADQDVNNFFNDFPKIVLN